MAINDSPDKEARDYAKNEAGENILLSAAAGSGKTYTLVERIFNQTVEKQSTSIDRLLVVTFTRAAAAELKNRIAEKYTAKIVENVDSNPELAERAKAQKLLLPRAMIGTIDQLCADIVKKHFTAIGIDPNFSTEDNVVRIIFEETEAEVLDEYYSDKESEKYAILREMNDILSPVADDKPLREMLHEVIENAIQNDDPLAWIRKIAENYKSYDIWFDGIRKECETVVLDALKHVDATRQLFYGLSANISKQDKFEAAFDADTDMLNRLLDKIRTKDGIFEIGATDISWAKLPNADKNVPEDVAATNIVKDEYNKVRVKEGYVYKKLDACLMIGEYEKKPGGAESKKQDFENSIDAMKKYASLISEITEKIYVRANEKCADASMFDFNQIEHFALEILKNEDICKGYKEAIDEIIVDEYQDTNSIQEEILVHISRLPDIHNMIMVGDVKQAIYGFRKATPKFFLGKYNDFVNNPEHGVVKILCRNFRSRNEVLGGVNSIFEKIMTSNTSGIDYADGHALNYGASDTYGEYVEDAASPYKCELIVTPMKDQSLTVARRILGLFESGFTVKGNPLKFGDITIIAGKNVQLDEMRDSLHTLGFPVSSGGEKNLFEQREVADVTDYLRLLDNPYHDIPLCSVLKSRFYKFTDNQLALLRAMGGAKCPFYDAVTNVANGNFIADFDSEDRDAMLEKTKAFAADFKELREISRTANLSQLVWFTAGARGYYGSIADSAKDNVHRLIDVAAMFDSGVRGGLYAFLDYVDSLAKVFENKAKYFATPIGEGGDAIKFMTVHKSKGLESPVVFLIKTENGRQRTGTYYIDDEFGVAFKYINRGEKELKESVPLKTLQKANKKEEFREAQRRLYVALTRAKEKLIVVATVEKEETIDEIVDPLHEPLATEVNVKRAGGFFEFMRLGVFTEEGRKFWNVYRDEELTGFDEITQRIAPFVGKKENVAEEITDFGQEDNEIVLKFAKIAEKATREDNRFPTKLSVSQLKKLQSEDDPENGTGESGAIPLDICDEKEKNKKGGMFFGTVIHKCLELLIKDRKNWPDIPDGYVKNCISDWTKRGIFTDDEAKLIDADMLVSFMKSERGQEVRRAEKVRTEVPFTAILNVSDYVTSGQKREKNNLAIQGVIDLYYKTEKGIIIIDFKTDRTDFPENYEYTDSYKVQLACYRDAVEKISGEKVAQCCLYFLRSRKELLV